MKLVKAFFPSEFSSALAIMASSRNHGFVGLGPSDISEESYDEARAEAIAEARVQQEEEEEDDDEEEEEDEEEDSAQEPRFSHSARDAMCAGNRASHCHIGFVTVVEMHAPLLRVPRCVARRPAGVPPGGDDGGLPTKRARTRRAAPTSAPTAPNNPAQTGTISAAAGNLVAAAHAAAADCLAAAASLDWEANHAGADPAPASNPVPAAHTAAANCTAAAASPDLAADHTAADPMPAASLPSSYMELGPHQAWGPGPGSTAAAPLAAASSTAGPSTAAEQLQWQQPAHTAICDSGGDALQWSSQLHGRPINSS